MTKQGYINQQKILQARLANQYSQPMYTALMKQVNTVIGVTKASGVQAANTFNSNTVPLDVAIGVVIKALYKSAYRIATPRTVINKRTLPNVTESALTYLNDHLLEKVVIPISQTSKDAIAKILQQSITEGWGVDKTVSKLKLEGIPKWRVKMIIRTESVRALNFSQLKSAADDRYEVEKMWIAIIDKRTRHDHIALDGIKINLFDEFPFGLLYPGDPNAAANETINCRCTLGYSVKKDENGKPVRNEGYWAAQGQ